LQSLQLHSIGLYLDNGIDWTIFDLAALSAGISVVPLPRFFSATQIAHAISDANLDGVVFDRVFLQCRREAGELVLTVDDSGPGLDAEQREKAPGRFYRAGDTNRSGAGLGLSIVKTIAQSHSAGVELSESKLGGLCVTVRFDLA